MEQLVPSSRSKGALCPKRMCIKWVDRPGSSEGEQLHASIGIQDKREENNR